MTINELATEAHGYLKRGKRDADGIGKILVPDTDKRPDWFQKLCHSAHGDMMPDDWRYEFIGDVLSYIGDSDSDDDDELREGFDQDFDGKYVYTHEQTAWLASRNDRLCYADDAARDMGGDLDTMQRIALGMLYEAREVFESVLSSLRDELDVREAA